MRLDWSPRALDDVDALAERAPRGAARVLRGIEALADSPFPAMFRRAARGDAYRVLVVRPYVVVYAMSPGVLTLVRVLDGRRRRRLT